MFNILHQQLVHCARGFYTSFEKVRNLFTEQDYYNIIVAAIAVVDTSEQLVFWAMGGEKCAMLRSAITSNTLVRFQQIKLDVERTRTRAFLSKPARLHVLDKLYAMLSLCKGVTIEGVYNDVLQIVACANDVIGLLF